MKVQERHETRRSARMLAWASDQNNASRHSNHLMDEALACEIYPNQRAFDGTASLDMELTEPEVREQQQIEWRRSQVLELASQGYNQREICQKLQLDKSAVPKWSQKSIKNA